MKTDALIASLSTDVPAISPNAVGRRLALGVMFGSLASILLLTMTLGVRPDLWPAMAGKVFWMKWAYTSSLAAIAIIATARLARPDSDGSRYLWLFFIPLVLLTAIAVGELIRTPQDQWLSMWLGDTWAKCPWLVLLLSVPIFAGLLWSFRRLAPTRLRAAGATAGLAAGSFAATAYCLHCPEVSALFVLTWYSLGILLAALGGALLGPRLLRW